MLGTIADDGGADGQCWIEIVALRQHSERDAAAPGYATGLRLHEPGEHPHQTRLAVAVTTHDPDAVALFDPHRDRVENDPGRVLQMQGLTDHQGCSHQRAPGVVEGPRGSMTASTTSGSQRRNGSPPSKECGSRGAPIGSALRRFAKGQRPRIARRMLPFIAGIGPLGRGAWVRILSRLTRRFFTSLTWLGCSVLGNFLM